VDASTPETVHVVEVSSFQLETTTTFHPWIALWLNLADDHSIGTPISTNTRPPRPRSSPTRSPATGRS
jgi:hypothetical protein